MGVGTAAMSSSSSPSTTAWMLAAAGLAGAVIGWIMARRHEGSMVPRRVFVLAIRLKFKPGMRSKFLAKWASLAEYCCRAEPRTLSYEACEHRDDPDALLIYERYVEERDLGEVHQQSPLFKAFRADSEVGDMIESRSSDVYFETNVGYMQH